MACLDVIVVLPDRLTTHAGNNLTDNQVSLATASSHHQGLSMDLSVATSVGSMNESVVTKNCMSLAQSRYDFHVNCVVFVSIIVLLTIARLYLL